jgi:geranylgeranyl diphosphate synthase type I
MQLNKYPSFFDRYQKTLLENMQNAFNDHESTIYDHLKYFLGWIDVDGKEVKKYSGKILRPSLCLLTTDSLDGDFQASIKAAVALEFIHNFSLIHDDIEDQDRFRRHRLSLWAIWGIPKAIVSGNALLTLGNLEIGKLEKEYLSPEIIRNIQKLLTISYLKMMEGQFLDIKYERQENISINEYLKMIELKTSTLLECSLMLGVLTSRNNNHYLEHNFSSLGKILGAIFQIRDDVLGIWGTDETGKPIGADIIKKKKSLPIVHVLSQENSKISKKVKKMLSQKTISKSEMRLIIEMLEKAGSEQYCQNLINKYWSEGEKIIKKLNIPNSFKNDFQELGTYLSGRAS